MKIKGRNAIISVGLTDATLETVGAATSGSLTVDKELIERAPAPGEGRWRMFVAGATGWSMEVGGMIQVQTASHIKLLSWCMVGTRIRVTQELCDNAGNALAIVSGWGYISRFEDDAPLNGNATYRITITGDGALDCFEEES